MSTAIVAATAPSADVIAATIPTLPIRSPLYTSSSPPTFETPITTSHAKSLTSSCEGTPDAAANGNEATDPTIITQASTDTGEIIRLEREVQSVAVAHITAAPSPPRIAIIYDAPSAVARRRA